MVNGGQNTSPFETRTGFFSNSSSEYISEWVCFSNYYLEVVKNSKLCRTLKIYNLPLLIC